MKKALSNLLFTAMIVAWFAFPTSAAWDGTAVSASLKGDGTQDSPYLVESAEDLALLANSTVAGLMKAYEATIAVISLAGVAIISKRKLNAKPITQKQAYAARRVGAGLWP